MISITADQAKEHFKKLMGTVQHEPVTIEDHGIAIAVIVSQTEYEQIKMMHLRAKLAIGEAQLNKGDAVTLKTEKERHQFFENIKRKGRNKAEKDIV